MNYERKKIHFRLAAEPDNKSEFSSTTSSFSAFQNKHFPTAFNSRGNPLPQPSFGVSALGIQVPRWGTPGNLTPSFGPPPFLGSFPPVTRGHELMHRLCTMNPQFASSVLVSFLHLSLFFLSFFFLTYLFSLSSFSLSFFSLSSFSLSSFSLSFSLLNSFFLSLY